MEKSATCASRKRTVLCDTLLLGNSLGEQVALPLSTPTLQRVETAFDTSLYNVVVRLLENECGTNLPFCDNYTASEMERIRYAAIRISNGTIDGLQQAIDLAKTDWRDLLMTAGFGDDTHAHTRWFPNSNQS